VNSTEEERNYRPTVEGYIPNFIEICERLKTNWKQGTQTNLRWGSCNPNV